MADPLLEVRGLTTRFMLGRGALTAVDDVSFRLDDGETLAIVGESGSGKSVLSLSILQLIDRPPGEIAAGHIIFKGEDLLQKSPRQMRAYRGNRISMIFQEPMVALNPAYTVGNQIAEAYRIHAGLGRRAALERAADMLVQVGISNPRQRLKSYPHEFSGGMRQRVMIAMALACNPDLLIADEPTTALDVTTQAQVLNLLKDLIAQTGKAMIFITHDLGVAAVLCDRIAVMYAGRIVEIADRRALFENPQHPYTRGLLGALPRRGARKRELDPIPGTVCDLVNPPQGCRFAPRCALKIDRCTREAPALRVVGSGQVACHRAAEGGGHV